MDDNRKILTIGLERAPFTELHTMLSRSSVAVYRVAMGQSAFELAHEIGFELVIVGHPLRGLKLDDFLAILRLPESASATSDVLVVTDESTRPDLQAFRGEAGSRIVSFDGRLLGALEAVAGHLGMERRLSQRVLARLEVEIEQRVETLVCQSENLSATGMLLRTDRRYPVGTRLVARFDLPHDGSRFVTDAEVVRHVDEELEGVRGIGIRFLDLEADATKRLEECLTSLLTDEE